MKFACVSGSKCKHYPHVEIPEGAELWVYVLLEGDWALSSRHQDCLSGLHYLARDDVRVSPYFADLDVAKVWADRNGINTRTHEFKTSE